MKSAQRAVDLDQENAFAHNVLASAYMAAGKNDLAMEEFDKAIELNPKLIDAHLKKGAFDLLSGRSEKAEDEFQTALKIEPDMLKTRVILAEYYIRQNKYSEAIKTLKEGLKENPKDAVLFNIMGAAYIGNKDLEGAIKYFEKAIESNPKFFQPYFNLAAVHISSGNLDKAVSEYKRVLSADDKNVQALVRLALVMESKKKDEEALSYYKKAVEQKAPAAYIYFAKYYLNKKDSKKAVEILDEALSVEPKDINALALKGDIYQEEKNYEKALIAFRDLKTLSPIRGSLRIADVYTAMGDYDNAIREIKTLAAKESDRVDIMGRLAALYLENKNFTEAESTAKTIILLQPKSDIGYRTLATVYLANRDYDRALKTLKEADSADPDSLETKMMMGQIYMSKGALEDAMDIFKKIGKIKPEYAPAYFYQANIFELTGNRKSAVEMHKKAISISPNYVPSLNNLAYLYAEGYGPVDEAVDMANLAKKLSPKNGRITDTLGWALYKKGNYDEALKNFIEATYYIAGDPTIRYHLGLTYLKKGIIDKAEEQLKNAVHLGESSKFPELNDALKTLESLKK